MAQPWEARPESPRFLPGSKYSQYGYAIQRHRRNEDDENTASGQLMRVRMTSLLGILQDSECISGLTDQRDVHDGFWLHLLSFIERMDFEGAIKVLSKAIEHRRITKEDSFYYHSLRAYCYHQQGDFNRARRDGLECVWKHPDKCDGYVHMAEAMCEQELFKAAKMRLREGLGRVNMNQDDRRLLEVGLHAVETALAPPPPPAPLSDYMARGTSIHASMRQRQGARHLRHMESPSMTRNTRHQRRHSTGKRRPRPDMRHAPNSDSRKYAHRLRSLDELSAWCGDFENLMAVSPLSDTESASQELLKSSYERSPSGINVYDILYNDSKERLQKPFRWSEGGEKSTFPRDTFDRRESLMNDFSPGRWDMSSPHILPSAIRDPRLDRMRPLDSSLANLLQQSGLDAEIERFL